MNIINIFKKSDNKSNNTLKQFRGTYRGFSPTLESPSGLGELEVSINKETMKLRCATGLEIITEKIELSKLNPMTKTELKSLFIESEYNDYIDTLIGFSYDGRQYIFTPKAFTPNATNEDTGLLIMGVKEENNMCEPTIFGPSVAYSPLQIKQGIYKKVITALNDRYHDNYPKGCFPTLENKGLLPE